MKAPIHQIWPLALFITSLWLGPLAHGQGQAPLFDESVFKDQVGPAPRPNDPDAPFEPVSEARSLALKDVIEEGLRENPDEQLRDYDIELLQLGWQDTYEDFWFPSISAVFQAADQRIGRLIEGGADTSPTSSIPTGKVGFEFGNYTVFNWGKDYLDYLNARETFQRGRGRLKEQRRELRLKLIEDYFELAAIKEKERIFRQQLSQTSFIYRMSREKAQLQRISKTLYYQTRTNFLRAQREYEEALLRSKVADEQFAYSLNDKPSTRYRLQDRPTVIELRSDVSELMKLSQQNAPAILSARVQMANAQRSYERVIKENLPLPEFSVNLGTYLHSFDQDAAATRYKTFDDSKNIELTASLNASWPIVGEGGIFNSRKNQSSLIKKIKEEKSYRFTVHQTRSDIYNLVAEVRSLEKQIEVVRRREQAAQKNYDSLVDSFLDGNNGHAEIKQAIVELRDAQLDFIETRQAHLAKKLALAEEVGLSDLPRENFEQVAEKVER